MKSRHGVQVSTKVIQNKILKILAWTQDTDEMGMADEMDDEEDENNLKESQKD